MTAFIEELIIDIRNFIFILRSKISSKIAHLKLKYENRNVNRTKVWVCHDVGNDDNGDGCLYNPYKTLKKAMAENDNVEIMLVDKQILKHFRGLKKWRNESLINR